MSLSFHALPANTFDQFPPWRKSSRDEHLSLDERQEPLAFEPRVSWAYARRQVNKPTPLDANGEIIDVNPGKPRRRRRWWWFLILAIVALVFLASRGLSIYVSALWFGSLGYAQVYWYMFKLKIELFVVFFLITVAILRGGFWLIERAFAPFAFELPPILINQQPLLLPPSPFFLPLP